MREVYEGMDNDYILYVLNHGSFIIATNANTSTFD